MTKTPERVAFRQIRLVIQLGRTQSLYSMTLRTSRGDTVFDRRLSSGVLAEEPNPEDVRDVLDTLERVLHDLRRRHRVDFPPQGPGAPGGGGGRSGPVTPGDPSTVPLSVVRDDP